MRAFRIILLALWGAAALAHADEFAAANELYDQGKFAEARAGYERLVSAGPWSANLFYNLGNADYRTKEPGRALLNYERALALDPAHPEARANLQLLRQQTGAKLPPASWLAQAFPGQRTDLYTVLAATAGWVAIFCLFLLATSSARDKSMLRFGALTGLLVAGYAGTAVWYLEQDRALAIVTVASAEAHGAPADSSQTLEPLPAGSRVRVLSERGDWTYCELPGQARGWIPTKALEKVRI